LTVSFLVSLALAEDLDVLDELGHEALRAQRREIDRGAGVEDRLERRDVDRERLDAVRILEATLRDPARHRHLSTLEREARAVVTGAGLLALHALTGGLARTRAATAAEPLLGLRGARIRVEIVQRDRHGESRGRAWNLARKSC